MDTEKGIRKLRMQVINSEQYLEQLVQHYRRYFGVEGWKRHHEDPRGKLYPGFYVLEIPPNDRQKMFVYCTVGMSVDRIDENLVELFVYSPKPDAQLVELMTICASYHRMGEPLNIHHTVNIGHPWLDDSKCDHGFISLPYLDGPELELFNFGNHVIHCYWFIPITENERNYKIEKGCEELERLFEEKQIDYLNPGRKCLVANK